MMNSAAPAKACKPAPLKRLGTCSRKREQVAFPVAVVRMMRLDTVGGLLGNGRLADELCITVRALNFKISGDRGASDANLTDAAAALASRGEGLVAHAQKLREAIQ